MTAQRSRIAVSLGIVFCIAFLLNSVSGCRQSSRERDTFAMSLPQQVCIGRLRMTVSGPASISFSPAEIDSVKLLWERLKPGKTFNSAWQDRVRTMSEDNILQHKSSSPGRVSAVYKTTLLPDPKSLDFDTWQDYFPFVLKASGDFGMEQQDGAKKYIASALDHFHVSDNSQPRAHDFCMEGGAVQINSDYGENIFGSVSIPFHFRVDPLESMVLLISMQVNTKAEPVDLFSRVDKTTKELEALGSKFKTLRRGERTVAGLKGYESVFIERGSGGYGFSAHFEFGGEPYRADAPQMTLTVDRDYPNTIPYQDVLALWDEVLRAMQIKL